MKYIIAIFCTLCLSLAVYAQDQHSIIGHVLNAKGEPMPGANVILVGTRLGAVTNHEGHFGIPRVPAGTYTLRVTMMGFQSIDQQITTQADAQPMQIRLKERPLKGEEVVVTATRTEKFKRDVPVIVNIVDDAIFQATQSQNLAEVVIFQPALRVETNCQNCGFSQVRLNGLEGGYSQILIDGRPIFSSLDGVYGLDQMPAAMIDRVEVVRGGGSALFGGNAIAGTINVITKEPISTGFEISTNQAYQGGDRPDRSVNLNASFIRDDQLMGLSLFGVARDRDWYDRDNDGYSEITTLENLSFGARTFYRTGPISKFILEFLRFWPTSNHSRTNYSGDCLDLFLAQQWFCDINLHNLTSLLIESGLFLCWKST